jgi:hypothetical protein
VIDSGLEVRRGSESESACSLEPQLDISSSVSLLRDEYSSS